MNNRNKRSNPEHELYQAILKLQSVEECYNFFVDLCTVSEMKAMELRSVVDGLITLAKVDNVHNRRQAAAYLQAVKTKDGKTAVQVLFTEVAPRYQSRNGGYTRVTKLGYRRGDNASVASIELV